MVKSSMMRLFSLRLTARKHPFCGVTSVKKLLENPIPTEKFCTFFSRKMSSFIKLQAYVNGDWVDAQSKNTFPVYNPATGEELGSVPDMTSEDTERAVLAAHKAFLSWRERSPKDRSVILRKWYDLMMENAQELGKLVTLEMGKPLAEGVGEVNYAAGFLDWFSGEARRVYGDVITGSASNKRLIVLKQPQGVCGMITPWNFPSAMVTRKAGAAIAAGCTVVLKPAEDTPFSALALCTLAEQAGLPAGVLNVVTCSRKNAPDVGSVLCRSEIVRHISFTGSTATGKILLEQSASTVKRCSLELGGNAPFIVFGSADLDKAVEGAMACKFRCSGQTCVCANRLLVHESIYDAFVDRLAQAMNQQLKMGNGLDAGVTQGPLINSQAIQKVSGMVDSAVENGARLVVGGQLSSEKPQFYPPTLLADVSPDMTCAQNEIFGPVAACLKFSTDEEAVTIANATNSGLAGYFYSQNLSQIWRVAERLEVGIVGVNEGIVSCHEAPFGGAKQSGLGVEGSKYGLDEYLQKKYLCLGGI